MKANGILLVLLLCYGTGKAQPERLLLKFAPLALVDDVSFPTIQAGAEVRLTKKISWYNEAGIKYRTGYFDNTDSSFIRSGGLKLKTELRYYLPKQVFDFADGYVAAAVFYTNDRYNMAVDWHLPDSTTDHTDVFGANKKVAGINLLCGGQFPVYKRWLLDLYAGAGIRYRSIRTNNKEYDPELHGLRGPIDLNISFMRAKTAAESRDVFTGTLTAGFRICYKLF